MTMKPNISTREKYTYCMGRVIAVENMGNLINANGITDLTSTYAVKASVLT